MKTLDLSNLSSNWRKLQANLDTAKSGTSKPKRKRQSENETPNSASNGNHKLEASTERPANKRHRTNSFKARSIQQKSQNPSDDQLNEKSNKADALQNGPSDRKDGLHVPQPDSAGKYVAMDCEMVGTGSPPTDSQLARVSLVSYDGDTLYDAYVRPVLPITDYRTFVSGIRPRHLRPSGPAISLSEVQKQVAGLLKDRVLVGHALKNDLHALLLTHPGYDIRDTARWEPFRKLVRSKTPGLKRLAREVLGLDIQSGEHDSVEDARIAMELYKRVRKEWEGLMAGRAMRRKKKKLRRAPP